MNNYRLLPLIATGFLLLATSCNDYETYGELKEKERNNISRFIADSAFVVISQEQFEQQGQQTTDDKQFVYLTKSGIYMQVVRQGSGEKIRDGETLNVLCRFTETSIQDSTILSNAYYAFGPDVMSVTRSGTIYSATFTSGYMLEQYGSTVPEGWLVPLQYVNLGRLSTADAETARVRLIVPHSQGTLQNAKPNVLPYFYDITFERGR